MNLSRGPISYHFSEKSDKGFTLLEILLVIAGLAILAGAVVAAINPTRQLSETRDYQRSVDVATIWSALQQYALNNPGSVPGAIPFGTLDECVEELESDEFTICMTENCQLVLPELLEDAAYLTEIPRDPSLDEEEDDYSGYNLVRDVDKNNRMTVCAPMAEGKEPIYLPR